MTKQLSPLRRKDIETGRKLEREAIIKYLLDTADIFHKELEGAEHRGEQDEFYHHCRACMLATKGIENGEHLI